MVVALFWQHVTKKSRNNFCVGLMLPSYNEYCGGVAHTMVTKRTLINWHLSQPIQLSDQGLWVTSCNVKDSDKKKHHSQRSYMGSFGKALGKKKKNSPVLLRRKVVTPCHEEVLCMTIKKVSYRLIVLRFQALNCCKLVSLERSAGRRGTVF